MDKFGVFPLNSDSSCLIRHKDLLKSRIIERISSYSEDVNYLDSFTRKYKVAKALSITNLLEAESVLLCDNINRNTLDKYKAIAESSLQAEKDIYASRKLFSELGIKKGKNIKFLENEHIITCDYRNQKLFDIPVPILAIMGIGENSGKFETQILAHQAVTEMGYAPVSICSNPLGSLFGMYSFPVALWGNDISFQDKVYLINRYIYDIYRSLQPDIIILSFPDGVIPLGENEYNFFSELSIVLSNAIRPDLGILNIYLTTKLKDEMIQCIVNDINCKYHVPVNMICESRYMIEYDPENKTFDFLFLDDELAEQLMPQSCNTDFPFIHLRNSYICIQEIKKLMQVLENNPDAI